MPPDFKFYGSFLAEEKWMSKIDFIYRVKSNCDCSEETHSRFLRFLYRLHFSQVKRTRTGEILVW